LRTKPLKPLKGTQMTQNNTGNHNTGHHNTGYYNTGNFNPGNHNTGNHNTGHHNTGDYNTGNFNPGNHNTGNRNPGHHNTGHYNTGNRNTGDYNTGNRNTGHLNTGDHNTGDRNTGHHNTGHRNTGHINTGDYNTGDYNTGNYNTGFFCTETPKATFFDQPTNLTFEEALGLIPFVDFKIGAKFVPSDEMTEDEKGKNPNHVHIGGFLRKHEIPIQEAFPLAWAKMDDETKQKFLNLPNFDAQKFKECTGVDVNTPSARKVKIRLSGGEIVEGEIVEE
jgi:hypothetical protein